MENKKLQIIKSTSKLQTRKPGAKKATEAGSIMLNPGLLNCFLLALLPVSALACWVE
jgi:hypothetical protein